MHNYWIMKKLEAPQYVRYKFRLTNVAQDSTTVSTIYRTLPMEQLVTIGTGRRKLLLFKSSVAAWT